MLWPQADGLPVAVLVADLKNHHKWQWVQICKLLLMRHDNATVEQIKQCGFGTTSLYYDF